MYIYLSIHIFSLKCITCMFKLKSNMFTLIFDRLSWIGLAMKTQHTFQFVPNHQLSNAAVSGTVEEVTLPILLPPAGSRGRRYSSTAQESLLM